MCRVITNLFTDLGNDSGSTNIDRNDNTQLINPDALADDNVDDVVADAHQEDFEEGTNTSLDDLDVPQENGKHSDISVQDGRTSHTGIGDQQATGALDDDDDGLGLFDDEIVPTDTQKEQTSDNRQSSSYSASKPSESLATTAPQSLKRVRPSEDEAKNEGSKVSSIQQRELVLQSCGYATLIRSR